MTATLTETRSRRPPPTPARAPPRGDHGAPGAAHGPDGTASHGGGRGGGRGGAMRVDPRDRAQLAETPVPLSRVLALFRRHRARVALVIAIIVVTSVVALAQPFLVREVVDVALPQQDSRLLLLAVGAMVAVAVVTQLLGVVQTWLSTQVGQRVMHELRTSVFTHLQRQSLGFFTRTRGGEVQSRLTNDVNGMQGVVTSTATSIASNLTTAVATSVRDGRAVVAAVAALAARHPAGAVADPQGRAAPPRGDRRPAAAPGRPQPPDRGGAVGQRRAPRQDARHLGAHRRAVRRRPRTSSSTSSCARSSPGAGGWRRCRSSSP